VKSSWALISVQQAGDVRSSIRHAAHLFEVGQFGMVLLTWLFRRTGDHTHAIMLQLSIVIWSTCPCWHNPGHCLCSTACFS